MHFKPERRQLPHQNGLNFHDFFFFAGYSICAAVIIHSFSVSQTVRKDAVGQFKITCL